MSEIKLHSAYVLHTRSYHDTSLLVELFTAELGRIAVIARGAKRPKSPFKGLLQPFIPLCVAFYGRGDLFTLRIAEQQGKVNNLQGQALFSGLYLNELLMRVLHRHDPHHDLFIIYQQTINNLLTTIQPALELRRFEKLLLTELGYGLHFDVIKSTIKISPEKNYFFSAEQGFLLLENNLFQSKAAAIFSGKNLLAIAENNWLDEAVLRDAQRLFQLALSPLLGYKPLQSLLLLK